MINLPKAQLHSSHCRLRNLPHPRCLRNRAQESHSPASLVLILLSLAVRRGDTHVPGPGSLCPCWQLIVPAPSATPDHAPSSPL